MKKKVGICFSKEVHGQKPLSHIVTKLPVYMRLFELMDANNLEGYVLTRKTYQGNGVFKGGWKYVNGKFLLIRGILNIDLVYDKTGGMYFPLKNDSLDVINNFSFKKIAWDKWETYKIIGDYMPQTLLINDQKNLAKILTKIKGDKVVLKPTNGLKGIGIFIGSKEDALRFKFNEKYNQYIAQEFVNTSMGIDGITPGRHDLRIVIVNGKATFCHVRIPAEGNLLSNVAQGGSLKEVDYEVFPENIKNIVEKVTFIFSKKFDNPIYSLDFGNGSGERPYIFEINDQMGFPGWGMKNRDKFLKTLVTNFKSRLSV